MQFQPKPKRRANSQKLKPGDPVILFDYFVTLKPDADTSYEPDRVSLRFPEEAGKTLDPFSSKMRHTAFDVAVRRQRERNSSDASRSFLAGEIRFVRAHCDVARDKR